MNSYDFQRILFRSAVSAMAIDGDIHDDEIKVLETLVKKSAYFLDMNYEEELSQQVRLLKLDGKLAINQYLDMLSNCVLDEKKKLLIIEVILMVIEADMKIANSECEFLHLVKLRLNLSDELLMMSFPKYFNYLIGLNNMKINLTYNDDIDLL